MIENEHKRAFVRPHKALSTKTQTDVASEAGYGIAYVVGQDVDDWPEYAKQVAEGDECGVARLVLLVSPDIQPPKKRRAELMKAVQAIEAAGGVVCELETGRRSDNLTERDEMLTDAWECIANGKLVPKRGTKLGRPKKEFTVEQIRQAEMAWFDGRNTTWGAVERALPIGMNRSHAYRMFGARNPDAGGKIYKPESWVYFMKLPKASGIKIGYSRDVGGRMNGIAPPIFGKPKVLATIKGDRATEKEMHQRFAEYRIKGEWFRFEGDLKVFVQELQAAQKRKGK